MHPWFLFMRFLGGTRRNMQRERVHPDEGYLERTWRNFSTARDFECTCVSVIPQKNALGSCRGFRGQSSSLSFPFHRRKVRYILYLPPLRYP